MTNENKNKNEEVSYLEITNMVIAEIRLMELEYKDLKEKNKTLSEYLRIAHARVDELLIENEEIKGLRDDNYQSFMSYWSSETQTTEISIMMMMISWIVTGAVISWSMLN